MDQKNQNLPLVCLIGDSLENFYQLGLKDRANHSNILNHLNSLVKTPFDKVDFTVRKLAKATLKQGFNHLPDFQKKMKAYSEGLGIKQDELTLSLLVPEIVSFLSKWIPGMPTNLLGCSSYFAWDDKTNSPIHGRVLDFPLQGSFDKNERALWTKLDNGPATLSYSSVGFPYPSITAMTEYGVSFALHQKFDDVFNPKGSPIFELIYNMLQKCGDLKSTLEFLKKNQSLTTWAFYMGFRNGDVLACDVMGKDLSYKTYKVEQGNILYFNNMLIDEGKYEQQKDFLPYGIHQYNQMRLDIADKKLAKLNKQENMTSLKLIKDMGTPFTQRTKKSCQWKCDTVTMSSVTICAMNPSHGESLFIPGPAPKFYQKDLIQIKNAFIDPSQKVISSSKSKTKQAKINGYRDLMEAQVSFDKGDFHEAYHFLQMAIDQFEGMPELYIAKFYFYVYQYIHEQHAKVRERLLHDFQDLSGKLPEYLNDHCQLFIFRLGKIINGKSIITQDDIVTDSLKQILLFEMKMPKIFFHKATSILTSPRIDTLDIIYAHVKMSK
jgi:hypothetical protein